MPISHKPAGLILLALLLLQYSNLHAYIFVVDQNGSGPYLEIQPAIDMAWPGDTVLVYPGTYYENLHIEKDLFLASPEYNTGDSSYIYQTIIDGQNLASALRVYGCSLKLRGLSVQNGNAEYGGGIYINEANVDITNCIVQNNRSSQSGGGIYCSQSEIKLSGTTLRNNLSSMGGGLYCRYSTFRMDSLNKCNIYLNHSHKYGIGCDILLVYIENEIEIFVDTLSVQNPDQYFIDVMRDTLNHEDVHIGHGMIEQVSHDLYISPLGNNNNTGLSPEEPLKNFWYANAKMLADSAVYNIYVKEGIFSPSANAERFPVALRENIRIKGSGKNTSIFEGDSMTYLFDAYGLDTLIVENLGIRNCIGAMIIGECKKIHLNNLSFKHSYSDDIFTYALQVYGIEDGLIENSDFIENYDQSALHIGLASIDSIATRAIVQNCRFIKNRLKSDTDDQGGALYATSLSGGHPDKSIQIISCEFSENQSKYWGPGIKTIGIENLYLINCTFANNETLLPSTGTVYLNEGGVQVYNCIFHDQTGYEIYYRDLEESGHEIKIMHTLLKNEENGIYLNDTLVQLIYDTTSCFDLPPQWVITGDYPYYLQAGSPCIDAGTQDLPGGVELPEFDIADGLRIAGDEIDMGAFEYIGPLEVPELPNQQIDEKLLLWPNPASDHVNIKCSLENPGAVRLRIYDAMGNLCFERSLDHQSGVFEHYQELSLDPGLHYFEIFRKGKLPVRKKLLIIF